MCVCGPGCGASSPATRLQELCAKLLRFGSSTNPEEELVSFDEYLSRMSPEQSEIYYLMAPTRKLAEASPYYEQFKRKGVEVLFLHDPIDELVMMNLGAFRGKALVSAETAEDVKDAVSTRSGEDKPTGEKLSDEEVKELAEWWKTAMSENVRDVRVSSRPCLSPPLPATPRCCL